MSFFTHIFLFLLLFSFSLYGSVGKVSLLKGEGSLERSGRVSPLQTGMKLEERDTLSTGINGHVQLIFDDKTVITLGSKAVFKVEEYVNEAVKPKAKFSFNQGTFKAITGKIGKTAPENFTLETKTATIGIRGTIIRGKIGRNEDKIMCEKGSISVRSHITGREFILPMGRLIVLPHSAPPNPPRDVQSADLIELGLNGTPPPENPDGGSPSGGSSGNGSGSGSSGDGGSLGGATAPLGGLTESSGIGTSGGTTGTGTGTSGGGFAPPLMPLIPAAALTALDTSFQTLQQETVSQEVLAQECPSGTTGTYPDCVALTCPSGTTGTYPDCVALTCPSGTTGTYPDCVALTCPSGTTGTYPDCVALTCPSGTTGTYPDCVALTCPSGTTGTYPDCVALTCPSGTTGTYPDCVALTCPSGTTGTYPDCVALTCPSGTTGVYPNCVSDYVPPTIYNASRNVTLSGKMIHSFDNIGYFYGLGSGSYTLVQNTLSTQSGGNSLYFYDVGNIAVSPPYEFKTVDWSVSLPNTEAGTTYSGYSDLGTIVPAMTFTSPDGSVSIASSVLPKLYTDNMQQFFVLYYSTYPNTVATYGKIFDYSEWFGMITPYSALATLFPNREVATYRSPVDSTDVITVNYGNRHLLGISMDKSSSHFSIGVGRIAADTNTPENAKFTGEDMSGYYDFTNLEIGTAVSGYIYGDKAQGLGGSSLVTDGAGTSYNIGGGGFYRDVALTTSDLTGNLAFSGYANAVKSDWTVYSAASSNLVFAINRDTGILGTSSIDLTAHNLGTVTFQDGAGTKSAYINDDYFATFGTASGKGYFVALDTYPPATNDYVSWGYWGYIDNVSASTLTVLPSTWVGGQENNASGHIASLIASGTTTSYTYNGHVIGDVNTGTGHYAIDTTTTDNAVKLDFDFGGGAGSLKNTSYIQFKTTEPTPQIWKISPSGSVGSTGFSLSNTDSVSWGGTLQSGSASIVSGQFYGPNAESVGGSFSATAGTQGAIGVFKGTR
ncbi:hypothetical protein Sulku_2095 [Sulfuricurvum kujiense DSM 16994]|uniref:FecR protein domain-containing protein n=1 Tax=Sulfuricurvum kujiense (strain ATCC BAA-921 / DSM 16994 / JCM 11577 / YK-1) TaxID=709032 RepID=E4U2Z1_SULKY|nr:transferrin-binding protein-like solute binding protein [Sulfuricurvum kujiense]ADR34755.1 hypothetical protein Sulku_2095 [Sulfuricurvum kujiense DSM 16994]